MVLLLLFGKSHVVLFRLFVFGMPHSGDVLGHLGLLWPQAFGKSGTILLQGLNGLLMSLLQLLDFVLAVYHIAV